MVAYTWEVFHTPTAYEHDGVLLEGVSFSRDICGDLDAIGEAHTRDLAQR
jgi:hypothetical protein